MLGCVRGIGIMLGCRIIREGLRGSRIKDQGVMNIEGQRGKESRKDQGSIRREGLRDQGVKGL